MYVVRGVCVGVKGNYAPTLFFLSFILCVSLLFVQNLTSALSRLFVCSRAAAAAVASQSVVKEGQVQSERIGRHLLQQLQRWAAAVAAAATAVVTVSRSVRHPPTARGLLFSFVDVPLWSLIGMGM